MNQNTYLIIHFVGIAALSLGIGGMLANAANRKAFSILQGIALLVMLVSGFGLLARGQMGYPHFAIAKTVLWVVIGALPVIFRKLNVHLGAAIVVFLALIGVMAWLGAAKPSLW